MTPAETAAADALIGLALAEDLGSPPDDVTSRVTIGPDETGRVDIVARTAGVLAGLPLADLVYRRLDPTVTVESRIADGAAVGPGTVAATVAGPLRSLLTGERTVLNFLTHLSGVATLTRRYVEAVRGTQAVLLDTRKTHPGYRLLEKYAVRCGGGANHRVGLYDGCLVKDNHLAAWSAAHPGRSLADALRSIRSRLAAGMSLEVEVDTLEQFADALGGDPDIVLLDNLPPDRLRAAVALRNERNPRTLLEASGGVNLETVRGIAETGVDRISVGALTHSAVGLDLGFDWHAGFAGNGATP